MNDVTRIGVLFGGRSGEHEVSCASALAVLRALDPASFEPTAVGIDRDGEFRLPPHDSIQEAVKRSGGGDTAISDVLVVEGRQVHLVRGPERSTAQVVDASGTAQATLDVVFPVLHGPYGEDGTLQGLLEIIDVPYVGSGVLGSAVGMDKVAMKRAFRGDGIPQVPYVWRSQVAWERGPDVARVVDELGLPLFVKPANLGSSVGITRVTSSGGLLDAVALAFEYDHLVVIESAAPGREIECGVLGGLDPEASLPGEIVVPGTGFYDFEAKYINDRAQTIVPADLPGDVAERIRAMAVAAFRAVGAWGLARVDFFWDSATDVLLVNEINTMPGFTPISMYAKMWEATGVPYRAQIDRLVDLAFERHALERRRGRA
ncbi:MAG: D-alanine--D-alanine ligase [Actinobacteria bacterium ATB1]|nr:D-alanine--D-alanine ligase [Actinobacteria bacterium ATB1]